MRIGWLVGLPVLLIAGGAIAWQVRSEEAVFDSVEREAAEAENLIDPPDADYFAHRYSYPTGHFEPRWLVDAGKAERAIDARTPGGMRTAGVPLHSPLALEPNRFLPLGPMPENNTQQSFNHVSGRANVIVVDPTATVDGSTVAFFGSDGGGVWKTTNCCTASTTWRVVTDVPEASSLSISDLTIDPANHNVLYAATGDLNYGSFSFGASGVLKSVDNGETWTLKGADVFAPYYLAAGGGFPQYQAVGKVVVDPNDSSKVIVGTKTGLYFSYDAGENWTGPCFTNGFSGGATPQRQDITGLLAVDQGGGVTRIYAAVGTRGIPTPVQPDLGANGANGVYRTLMPTSGCPAVAAWSLLNDHWPAGTGNGSAGGTNNGRIELAVAPSNHQRLYAEVQNTNDRKILAVYRSDDGGATWVATLASGVNTDGSTPGCEINSANGGAQMWYDAGLTVDPNNPNRVWMSTIDATLSNDAGANFYDVTCGYGNHASTGNTGQALHVDHHARAYVGNDSNRLLLGSDGGVYYTGNATAAVTSSTTKNTMSFIALNDSINSIEFYYGDITANFATASTPAIGAGAQDNGCSRAAFGATPTTAVLWNSNCSGDGTTTRIEPVFGNVWFNSSQSGALGRSTSGGASGFATASANTGGTWGGDNLSFIMSYDIYKWGDLATPNSGCDSTNGCNHMIAGTNRLWETTQATVASSTTLRASWKARTPNLTKNNLIISSDNRSYINYVSYSFKDPTVAIVGTNDGNVQVVFGLGTTVAANCPAAPPLDGNCATAVDVTGGNTTLPNRPVQSVRFDPTSTQIAYASLGGFDQNTPTTPGHLFRLDCTANCASFTWTNKSGNLPNIPVQQVMPNPKLPQQVFAGTDWGLYYTDDITVASPTWYRFEDLPHVMVWELVVDRGFTTLAAFTRSRGAWVWPLPSAAIGSGSDLGIAESGPASTTPGNDVSYTVTVTNSGPQPATGVSVGATIPAGLSFVSNTGTCTTAFPCSYASIPPNATRSFVTTLHVPSGYVGPSPFNQLVTVTSGVADGNSGNNSASVATAVSPTADPAIAISGPANVVRGTPLTYTLTLTNNGAAAAGNVVVDNPTPVGLSLQSLSGDCVTSFPCSFATLAGGATRTITAVFSVPPNYSGPATIVDTATVSSDNSSVDVNSANNSAGASTNVTSSADVAIAMSGPSQVVPGNTVVFTITVTSTGPSSAAGLQVADPTPAGFVFVSTSGDCSTAFPCSLGGLDPGQTRTITATFSVPANYAGPSPISNVATVSSSTADPASANNSRSVDVAIVIDGLFSDGFE